MSVSIRLSLEQSVSFRCNNKTNDLYSQADDSFSVIFKLVLNNDSMQVVRDDNIQK